MSVWIVVTNQVIQGYFVNWIWRRLMIMLTGFLIVYVENM